MREINKIAEGLFEKIRDRFEDVSLGDDKAKATQDPEKARFFNFDYTVDDENLGNVTLSLIDETSLKVYFSKNISDDLDDEQRHDWYSFLKELRRFAKSNLLSFEPRDITRSTLKHRDLQQVSKADSTYTKDEVVAESLYGTRKSSYERRGPVRLIVRHSKALDEVENRRARAHNISNIYLETQDGERFRLPVKSLRLGRALAQHVKHGGSMHDELGQHICEMAEECAKLKPFLNNTRNRTFEDSQTHAMVEAAFEYHGLLNNTLKRMTGKKGYQKCKEQFVATSTSYIPEVDTDEMKQRFEKRTFDERLEEALPLVHKAYNMKKENKFAEQFVNWADAIAEGTWAVPNTDDDVEKLIDILSNPLPVGVDGQNATNALYNLIGDDKLFDKFLEISKIDPEQDVGDLVADWLQEHLPHIYQQIENEIGDPDYPAEPAEQDSEGGDIDEGNTYGSGDSGVDGVVYEEHDIEDHEQVCVYCGEPRNDKMGCCDENHWVTKKEFDQDNVNEGEEDQDDLLANTEAIQSAIIRRILNNISEHSELLKKAGPDGVMNASLDVASFHAPMEEIGTSDISIMVREVYREVGVDYPESKEEVDNTLEEAFNRLVNEDLAPKAPGDSASPLSYAQRDAYCDACDRTEDECVCDDEQLDEAVDLKQLIGQEVYVPSEGTTGKILDLAPGTDRSKPVAPGVPEFSNSLVVQLKNGRQTVLHFKDVTATKPGPLQQLLDKAKSVVGLGPEPKRQPKPYGQVSDINTPQQFQKLAGIK